MMLFIDYETFYSKEYKLRQKNSGLIRTEYINDPRFKIHGAAVSLDGRSDTWVTGAHMRDFFGDMGPHLTGMCCHNGLFDHGITQRYFGHLLGTENGKPREVPLYDTMSMARAVVCTQHPTVGASLDALGRFYWPNNPGLHKQNDVLSNFMGILNLDPEQEQRMGAYACQDNRVMRALFTRLLQEDYPWRTALVDIHLTLAMGVYPQLRMNTLKAAALYAHEVRMKEEAAKALNVTRKQLRSGETFADMLRACGCEPPMKFSDKQEKMVYAFAANDENFKALAEHPDIRVRVLYETRVGEKAAQAESRAKVFARLPEALPIPLRYAKAHTGRHAGDEYNMQNLERGSELRDCVTVPPRHKVLVRDLSQIELRMNAWWCGENWLLELLRNDGDPYCILAAKIFGRPITKADEAERFVGKQGELSCGYGSGDVKILATLKQKNVAGADERMAKSVKVGYRSSHPAIVDTWGWLQKVALPVVAGYGDPFEHKGVRFERGRVVLPSGRSMWYPDLHVNEHGDWVYRVPKSQNKGQEFKKIFGGAFLENIIQALSYDVFMFHARMAWEKYGLRIAMAVHDEMVFVVPDEKSEWANKVIEHVQTISPPWCPDLPLKGEGSLGNTYLEAK